MSGGPAEVWESKLADEELRQLSGPETASVIVQLELPRPRVEMERSERGALTAGAQDLPEPPAPLTWVAASAPPSRPGERPCEADGSRP